MSKIKLQWPVTKVPSTDTRVVNTLLNLGAIFTGLIFGIREFNKDKKKGVS